MEAAEENLNQALGQLLLEEEDDKGIIVEYCPKKRFHKFNDEIASSPLKVVYRAYDAQQGREVLWHSIKVRGISKKELSRIHQELFLMKSLKHENILGCIDFWVKLERKQIVFITQITNGGCLRSYLDKIKTTKLKVLKSWCIQVLQGLVYLHDQKKPMIHQSIRCDNIYINSTSNDLKMGEVGVLASTLDPFQPLTGSYQWSAPETFQNIIQPPSDIYSFGMTLLQIVTGKKPYYQCKNQFQISKMIFKKIKPKNLKSIQYQELRQIIDSCISFNPQNRPTAKELLQHNFWKSNQQIDNNSLKLINQQPKQSKFKKKSSKSNRDNKTKSYKQIKLSQSVIKKQYNDNVKFVFNLNNKKKYQIMVQKQQDEYFEEYILFLTKKFQDKIPSKESTNIFLPLYSHKFQQKEINKDDNTHFLSYGNPTMKTMRLDYLYESRIKQDQHKKSITNFSQFNQPQIDILQKIQQMFLGMYEMYRNKIQSWNIEQPIQQTRFLLQRRQLQQLQIMQKQRIHKKKSQKNNNAFLANSINFMDFLNNSQAPWPNQVYNYEMQKDITLKYPITKFQDALSLNYSSIHNNRQQKQPIDFDVENARYILNQNDNFSNHSNENEKLNESFIKDELSHLNKSKNQILEIHQEIMKQSQEQEEKEKQKQKEKEREMSRQKQKQKQKEKEKQKQRQKQGEKQKDKQKDKQKQIQKKQSKKHIFQQQQIKLHKLIFEKKPSITKDNRLEGEFQQSNKNNLI